LIKAVSRYTAMQSDKLDPTRKNRLTETPKARVSWQKLKLSAIFYAKGRKSKQYAVTSPHTEMTRHEILWILWLRPSLLRHLCLWPTCFIKQTHK